MKELVSIVEAMEIHMVRIYKNVRACVCVCVCLFLEDLAWDGRAFSLTLMIVLLLFACLCLYAFVRAMMFQENQNLEQVFGHSNIEAPMAIISERSMLL